MKKGLIILVLSAISVLIIGVANTFLFSTTTLSNIASIKTIGVSAWKDSNATIPLTFIDWGIVEPSQNKTLTYYLRNDANVPSILDLQTENWSPSYASDYIELSWNLNGTTLDVNEIVETRFTLSVSPYIENITTFSFDITITARG